MVSSPSDRLAHLLAAGTAKPSDSASLSLPTDVLELAVQGFGAVSLPVRAAHAKRLISVARPAHFGRGEETLRDTSVRDTWELVPEQITLGGPRWEAELADALERLAMELGIPRTVRLRAELHSVLVYGRGQFFATHQDSEKHDDMVATLVVFLPSAHSGGELVVDDAGVQKQYRGSREALELVAFYADRRHEVLPVRTGYRVTMTFNLLRDDEPEHEYQGSTAEVSELVREHFRMPIGGSYGRPPAAPERLVVLLDHEYSQHSLKPARLKGADAERAALLSAATDAEGYEQALALVEIEEIWQADPADAYDDGYGYGARYHDGFDDDEFDEEDADDPEEEYDLGELIDGSMVANWWDDPQSRGEISLSIRDHEVCAPTPSSSLQPYSSDYESYMGNYGNTLDRWYRRAALVIWPRDRGFAIRAEATPTWALDTILHSLGTGELDRARAEVTALVPFWQGAPDAFANTLRVAAGVRDKALALDVLTPFAVERLSAADAVALAALGREYPESSWWAELLQKWDGAGGRYASGRNEWVESVLESLCHALDAVQASALVDRLSNHLWEGIRESFRAWIGYPNEQVRIDRLRTVGPAVSVLLSVAGERLAASIIDELQGAGSDMLPLLMSALRRPGAIAASGFDALADVARAQLAELATRPERAAGDWSIAWTSSGGDDADRLAAFLGSSTDRVLEWPLAEPRRQAIHRSIDIAGLPVTHRTRRTGRPFTLILTKTDELFTRELQARQRIQQDQSWLSGVAPGRG